MKKEKQQVELYKLVFTHNWEDPESDHSALQIKSNDTVMAITSGGCNVLGFLLFDPKVIYSIDINPAQSYLLELKIAAIKVLSYYDFIAFIGLRECPDRNAMYSKIKDHLSKEACDYWDSQSKVISSGLIMNGRYERFVLMAGKFIKILQGRKRVLGLFDEKTKEEQKLYFEKTWNTKRFHFLFKILFNKYILAKRGLVADYFHFDDGSKSFSESFHNRSKLAFRDIPLRSNYFMALYLQGKYLNEDAMPSYLKKENYKIIKSRVDRINIITRDAQGWLESLEPGSIDCFALSNICELMSENDTNRLFENVLNASTKEARIIFRNLMVFREVPAYLKDKIVKNETLSREIKLKDRSFVYGNISVYNLMK